MSRITASICALVVVAGAAPLQAQSPTSPTAVFEMADRQDWLLRVELENGQVVEGRVRDIQPDEVRLEGGRFRTADVIVIERGRREGSGAMRGALIGAGVGVASMVLLLNAVPDAGDDVGLIVAGGAFVGGVIGGVIGATFDPSETEWQPLWPAGDTD